MKRLIVMLGSLLVAMPVSNAQFRKPADGMTLTGETIVTHFSSQVNGCGMFLTAKNARMSQCAPRVSPHPFAIFASSYRDSRLDSNHSAIRVDRADSGNSSLTSYWLDGGIGGGSTGFATGVSASYLSGYNLYTVRYAYNAEMNLLSSSPAISVWDVGLLYGRTARNQMYYSSASAGVGLVGGVRRGKSISGTLFDYESHSYSTIGIPLQVELFLTPRPFFGIGLSAAGNLNPERSFADVRLCLRVGKLR